ncbi:proton-coupled amino acid transporter 4-like, partial [Mizuhopecten yessoensis]|uniref:proton-coupled amino acid transporter 4-like n=1 Tax=Mizuhopecten yessoensis TaxID=6573 RepID=UPI000B45BC81
MTLANDFEKVFLYHDIGYIGIGFLGLPYMVKLLGLWGGSGGLLFYGILAELGALILTGCTQRLTERTGQKVGNIGSVLEMSMKVGPLCVQHHAGKLRVFIDCCIFVSYGLYMPDLISLMNLVGKD